MCKNIFSNIIIYQLCTCHEFHDVGKTSLHRSASYDITRQMFVTEIHVTNGQKNIFKNCLFLLAFAIFTIVYFDLGIKHHIPDVLSFDHRLVKRFSTDRKRVTGVDVTVETVIFISRQMYHLLVPWKTKRT